MKSKSLASRLEKNQRASIPVSFRLSRAEALKLAKIENLSGVKFDWLCRLLLRALIHRWNERETIEFPAYVGLFSLREAQQRNLPNSDKVEYPDENKPDGEAQSKAT